MDSRSTSKAFPGFSRLFDLHDPSHGGAFRVSLSVSGQEEATALLEGAISPASPIPASWYMGRRKPSDLIGTGWSGARLVSERTISVLRACGFSGWKTYSVAVSGKEGESIPGYHGLAVTGRCGAIDYSKSERFKEELPGGVFTRLRGYYFNPESWDGSDLFMAENRLNIFVVQEVKEVLAEAGITNIEFTRMDQIEYAPWPPLDE